jgi:rubrerythrin
MAPHLACALSAPAIRHGGSLRFLRLRSTVANAPNHRPAGVNAVSRQATLRIAALGVLAGAPLVGWRLRLGDAVAAPSKAQDARILQLVLQLEYTQVAFYEQALQKAGLQGELRTFAQTALGHERAHLAAVKSALGSTAGPKPSFDFGAAVQAPGAFKQAAIKLEDLAISGYNGQATNLTSATLAAAAKIVSVEARHASWVRTLSGLVAAPEAVDKPITARQLENGLHELGWRA